MTTPINNKSKKRIFWFEDDTNSLSDYCHVLCEKYEVFIGAHEELIKVKRDNPFNLVLLDIMIHRDSFDSQIKKFVKNIEFENVHWEQVGVEFLKRLRKSEYESYGFQKDVPIIAATAVVDSATRRAVEDLGVNDFLVKPFTMYHFKLSIEKALTITL